ncbi:helix-turn-helix transcriptional regulator [Pedobacter sp. BS3]|uniref:helix-turn-helix domain-containing protein n=1 Tax=Pedobacter sp. BS3 TaxID=2567937 RepID=UPI0011ECFA06|nr:helix-turn-helix transcriptional regulator [Pedobacter sp. BS3]TZF81461.1 helix-turn-helix transcriptional regulator [Pedobacter sp. BS3]
MYISNTLILQLNLLATIVLLTVSCGLFFRKNNIKANIFLGFLLLYPAITIMINAIFIIFRKHNLLFLAPVNIGINLTFGPVLLSYLHFIQGKGGNAAAGKILHFVPALIVFTSSVYYLFIPGNELIRVFNDVLAGNNTYINCINLFLLIHIGIYLYIAWRRTKVYEARALDLGISETETSVKWQKAFLICIISVNILLLLAYSLPVVITGKAHIYSDLIATPVTALIMYGFMIYKGLSYHVIYSKPEYQAYTAAAAPLNSFIEEVEASNKQRRQSPVYEDEFINEVNARLNELFQCQKIHVRPGLKLHDVAAILSVSPAVLSGFINSRLKMTFFEMVNHYRVEEAKQLLVHPDYRHYKIEYIGEASGFNSRASFFSVFKKQVGKTPQAFKDEHSLPLN